MLCVAHNYTYTRSTMFSHVTVGCSDLHRASAFYDAVLKPIDLIRRKVVNDGGPSANCWVSSQGELPRFYVYIPYDGAPASAGNGSMVAFMAPSPTAVHTAYFAGLAMLGADAGPPGWRAHYGEGYYGAYLRDPDGNKIHIVFRGDLLASDVLARNGEKVDGDD